MTKPESIANPPNFEMAKPSDFLHYSSFMNGKQVDFFRTHPRIHYCEPEWSWAPAPMQDYDLWCVLGGCGHLTLEGKTHALLPGTCFLFAPGARPKASHEPNQPLTVFVLHMDGFPAVGRGSPLRKLPPLDEAIQVTDWQRLRRLSELLEDSSPVDSQFKQEEANLALCQLLHLLCHPRARSAPVDPRIERVRRQIHQRLSFPWTVEAMSAVATLSTSRFNVLFNEQIGQSPLSYLIAARINRARTLLRETHLTQFEIADALGYTDVYFFNRQFKKETGIPPGRYRGGRG